MWCVRRRGRGMPDALPALRRARDYVRSGSVLVGGDPVPGRGLYQLAQHDQQPRCPVWSGSTANNTGFDPEPVGI